MHLMQHMLPWVHPSPWNKRHLDWFSCFAQLSAACMYKHSGIQTASWQEGKKGEGMEGEGKKGEGEEDKKGKSEVREREGRDGERTRQ